MVGLNERDGELYMDDVPLSTIAQEVGTPCYVYSAAHIRAQYDALSNVMKETLPEDHQPLLCYACKANGNVAILKLLQSLGSSIEVVSAGELKRALKAGFDPSKIVVEGVGKTRAEIAFGLESDVHQFNIESLGELELINAVAAEMGKTANVVFRLNPDIGGAAHAKITTGNKESKFGLSPDKVTEGFALAGGMDHIEALGIFTHIGSQITDPEAFTTLFTSIAEFVEKLRDQGYTISRLDIGGGFPIQYQDEDLLDLKAYAEAVRDIIVPLDTEIIMEPGRYMVGNSGALLTEVLYTKESYDKNFLIIDAGMHSLIRPALYDAYHGIEPVRNRDAAAKTYDVAGPICESSDIFAYDRSLPEMQQGDLAVIRSAGAYGFVMASNYNTHPLPPEILVEGNQYMVIRPRQDIDSVIEQDIIPDWLK